MKSNLDLFKPLADNMTKDQIKLLVSQKMRVIRNRRKSFSLWDFIIGKRDLNPGGVHDILNDEQ